MEMPTGYDLLEHSHEFRMHMLRRLAAGLIDGTIIFIPIICIIYLLNIEPKELFAGVLSGLVWFSYSTLFESRFGSSLGKKAMGLIVVSLDGPMKIRKVMLRSVPKIFWYLFLPIDIFLGLVLSEDPRQRWVDGIVKTVVIKKNN